MALCKAKNKNRNRCGNIAEDGIDYCRVHKKYHSRDAGVFTVAGAVIGNAVVPGFGGVVGGATSGWVVNKIRRNLMAGKTRVFISFDFDNDRQLKDFIIGQSKHSDSPFSVEDHSLKEAAPERSWKDKARAAIKRSNIVVVMVGPKTHKAPGVLAEVAMAREEGRPIVQVIGYKDGNYTAVPNAGRLYKWNWENLKKLLG